MYRTPPRPPLAATGLLAITWKIALVVVLVVGGVLLLRWAYITRRETHINNQP